ncbi:MAG TPA: hypothetical protein VNO35_24615 [Steroidobacteraceae bacterium]|nr:hypothetical protein [Steroidobacteraceae bacterium]
MRELNMRGPAPWALCLFLATLAGCGEPQTPYLGANHIPDTRDGWRHFQTTPDPSAPQDEAKGGRTALGTPITPRLPECFPAEPRNIFSQVDQVADPDNHALRPFDYTDGHAITPQGQEAIQGQNTWMMWGEGNEAFWGWLQERGYGLVDFLALLDSRQRDTRFQRGGMINDPDMQSSSQPLIPELGLFLDVMKKDVVPAKAAPPSAALALQYRTDERCMSCHSHGQPKLFETGSDLYEKVIAALPKDGVSPSVYGYPSGVLGLRLFPNPDFFGKGPVATRARQRWQSDVVAKGNAYYEMGSAVHQGPPLVRPFRVSMSCAFCHLGPHPLNPPKDPEHPDWSNLSSTIGNQYWAPQPLFANMTPKGTIFYQFLRSQQPGTVDTSLVSTDHINNANTITAVFDIDARLERASHNGPEDQSAANLLAPIAPLPYPLAVEHGQSENPRHTPRVLLDGADSIGAFGALSRVYLNIGTFPEEWQRCHNPIIGYVPQRPFSLATLQSNSVYWQTADRYRIPYLVRFFTYRRPPRPSIVAPMKLETASQITPIVAKQVEDARHGTGREVFLNNCAICHSSRQPDGFQLAFDEKWRTAAAPAANQPAHYTLPTRFTEWEEFRNTSTAYKDYLARLHALADPKPDEFFTDNFLSTDVRIPITLVGTNSGRAVGTNGMRGQVWDNFSSETYKQLKAVGAVRFFNPFSQRQPDEWGNNDEYYPPPGGPGYNRPASLISLWATAPYLHNNALGQYPQAPGAALDDEQIPVSDRNLRPDPSVEGRLRAFEDGIDKLFSSMSERGRLTAATHRPYGDMRGGELDGVIGRDAGFIYRMPEEVSVTFAAPFTRPILEGVLGPRLTNFASLYVWVLLTLGALLLAIIAQPRHAAFFLLLASLASTAMLVLTRFDRLWEWLWLIPVLTLLLALYLWLFRPARLWSRVIFVVFALGFAFIGREVHGFVAGTLRNSDGTLARINIEHIPKGTPVNLLMNLNPQAPTPNLIRAVAGLTRGLILSQRARLSQHADDTKVLEIFQREAGQALLEASKCPDFVLDRGHWFAQDLKDEDKQALKEFLRTL